MLYTEMAEEWNEAMFIVLPKTDKSIQGSAATFITHIYFHFTILTYCNFASIEVYNFQIKYCKSCTKMKEEYIRKFHIKYLIVAWYIRLCAPICSNKSFSKKEHTPYILTYNMILYCEFNTLMLLITYSNSHGCTSYT